MMHIDSSALDVAARRARRPDRRRQPPDHARRADRRRAAAARRLRHEGRTAAQHLSRRRRPAGALHPQRLRPRHGARRRREPEGGRRSSCCFPRARAPCGRRSTTFKPGITLIAHLARVPIQTVLIESDSPYLTKGWPLLRPPPMPGRHSPAPRRALRAAADHRALLRRLERYFRRGERAEAGR